MLALLNPSATAAAVSAVTSSDAPLGPATPQQPQSASHDDCVAVHQLLRDTLQDPAAADKFLTKSGAVFQWSAYFKGQRWQARQLENGMAAAAL